MNWAEANLSERLLPDAAAAFEHEANDVLACPVLGNDDRDWAAWIAPPKAM